MNPCGWRAESCCNYGKVNEPYFKEAVWESYRQTDRQTDVRWEGLTSGHEYFMWLSADRQDTCFMNCDAVLNSLQTEQNTCFFDSTSSGASVHAVRTIHEHECKLHVVFFSVMTRRTLIAGTNLENSRGIFLTDELRKRWRNVAIIAVYNTSCRWKDVHFEVVWWMMKFSATVTTSIENE